MTAVAALLPFPVEVEAEVGGLFTLQILMGSRIPDGAPDRAGIDPHVLRATWWIETGEGEISEDSGIPAAADSALIAYWLTQRAEQLGSPAAVKAHEPQTCQPADAPTKILMNGPNALRVVGSWPNSADIETWRLDDLADAQAARTAQRAQNAFQGIPDTFEQSLAAHSARLTATQKAALLPFVQARILSHTSREEPA